jgi:glycosyltransferase involved in cell wall biosynthesis
VKIAFAMYGTGLAGGVRAIFEVANRLHERGYNIRIIALGGDHSWFKVKVPIYYVQPSKILNLSIKAYRLLRHIQVRNNKVNYFDVSAFARKLGFHADLIRTLVDALNEHGTDAAIATWYPTALSVWLSNASKPLYFMQDFHELVQEADGVYGLRLFETTLRLPFHFLANSTYTRDIILSYNKEAKVTITGVGVDLNTFYPRRTRIINSNGKPIVMAIIRDQRFKGGDVAIRALNLVNKKQPIHAILVGSRRTIDKLFMEVKPEFRYTIFSNVDDEILAKLYSNSDIFMFTSYKESFGLPPLEAMASGTAVVTTDCGGIRDYAVDGYNSLITPPGDPMAIAEAVIKILNDQRLRDKLSQNGLETAKQWTWDRVTDKFEKAIKEDIAK